MKLSILTFLHLRDRLFKSFIEDERKSRIRSISETNPVFTIEAEVDKSIAVTDPSRNFYKSSNDRSPCIDSVTLEVNQWETESGYGSCLSSRKTSASGSLTESGHISCPSSRKTSAASDIFTESGYVSCPLTRRTSAASDIFTESGHVSCPPTRTSAASDIFTESGYVSCPSSRKPSTASDIVTVPPVSVTATTPTEVSFARQVSGSEEISFDELSARRSTRGRSLSNGSLAVSKSGRRSDPPSPNRLPDATDDSVRESFQRCPSENCISPGLCESFRRGPSVGFRQFNKRERRFSVCSENIDASGVNVNLHNVIGKRGTGKGQFRNATSVSHVSSGSIVVTDIINCRVTLFHGSGRVMSEIQTGPGTEPWATAVLPNGKLVVSLQRPGCLAIFSANGEFCTNIACDLLVKPSGVATDRKGRIIVSDVSTDSVYILDQDGEVLKRLGGEPEAPIVFEEPRYVNVTSKGKILVCDSAKHCVHVFDSEGNFLHSFGSYGQDSGQFRFPYGITSDFEDNIYVADYYNNRVCMFAISGEFLGHIITPCMKLKRPQGLDIRDGMTDSILYVSHGEMKAQEVVAFKLITGSKNRLKKAIEVHL